MRQIHTHALPCLVDADELAPAVVIVVDLLRASTTICHALHAGAASVIPLVDVADAQAAIQRLDRRQLVLGGERKGRRIQHFELGNSPTEYTPAAVAGRKVLFTTTNGTRALHHARQAREVLVGAAVNARAVATAAAGGSQRVDILCAGTDGQISDEDLLAAGAIASRVVQGTPGIEWDADQATESACQAWQALTTAARSKGWSESAQLAQQLTATLGGQNLIRIGKAGDLLHCAQLDTLPVVPSWDRPTGQIRLR